MRSSSMNARVDEGTAFLGAENQVVVKRDVGGTHVEGQWEVLWHPIRGAGVQTRGTGGIMSLQLHSTLGYESLNPTGSLRAKPITH